MKKATAIEMLGGTPKKAAQVLGYGSPHAIYQWPEVLPMAIADRVRGAAQRIAESGGGISPELAESPANASGIAIKNEVTYG